MNPTTPSISKAIIMLLEERNLPYEEARDQAIVAFSAKGWPIPSSIESLYGRKKHERNL